MDRNFLLAFALSFMVLVLWSMYTAEPRPEPGMVPAGSKAPTAPQPGQQPTEIARESEPLPGAQPELPGTPQPGRQALVDARVVSIETELFSAELSTRGGALNRWELKQYRDAHLPGDPPVELTTLERGEAALTTTFEGLGLGDLSAAAFEVSQPSEWEVSFQKEIDGVTVRKHYEFDPDSYLFRLLVEVSNTASHAVQPRFDLGWRVRARETQDFTQQMLLALDAGDVDRTPVASIGNPGFMSRLFGGGSDPEAPIHYQSEVDWAGVETQYFLSVILPENPRDAEATFLPMSEGGALALVGYPPTLLPGGQRLSREYRVYLGPKETERLEAVGAQLDRSIDRGWSWVAPLTALFAWLLRATYSIVPNYGWAIIAITVGVRLITAPLMSKQMRSMRKMGELQPKMKELQAKYGDDRQKQSEEMMKLYRSSGVNPLGGCFPMLLQLPVFIGLYYALQSSIELRQAPFMLWINDLSAPESLFTIPGLELPVRVLPLLMGVSMIFQQRLTPTTIDPAQARMMMTVMPVMFTVLFYQFPSGLVLYWFVSNLLGIGHQLWVNRGRDREAPKPKPAPKAAPQKPAKGKQRARR